MTSCKIKVNFGNIFLLHYVYHLLYLIIIIVFTSFTKVGPVKLVNFTSWVAVVTPTDCPKSVLNRCVIEIYCGVVLSLCPFDISVSKGAFVKI